MAVYEVFVNQFLPFIQNNDGTNPQGLYADNFLAFTQEAKNWRRFVGAENTLQFGQLAVARKSINHISVTQYFELHQSGNKFGAAVSVEQWLAFGQLARVVEYEIVTQTLTFTQLAEAVIAKAGFDTLTFTQTASANVIRTREIVQTLVVHQGGVAVLPTRDEDQYSITLPTLTGPNAPECST